MKWNAVSRRHFLQGAGGFTLALPFLESLLDARSAAAAAAAPTRYIAIRSGNGQRKMYWDPRLPAGAAFASAGPSTRYVPLTAFNATGVNQVLGTDLVPFHPKMNFVQGLDVIPPTGHSAGVMVGNCNDDTPTIDQVLGASAKVYPTEPPIRTLLLGSLPASTASFSFTVSNGVLVNLPGYQSPQGAFDRVFFSASAAQQKRHLTVVDAALADYRGLKANPRLSAGDRHTVDRHLTTIQELQIRLRTQAQLTCSPLPSRPNGGAPGGGASLAVIENHYSAMNSVLAAAVMCGTTRVAALGVGHGMAYGGSDWHGPSHNREDQATPVLLEINNWIARKVVLDLLQKLDVPESNGKTYLDNSLVHWGNEISIGWSHRNSNLPTVLFGSLGGRFKTGNFVSYFDDAGLLIPGGEYAYGRPINQLWASILQGMGMSPADYETGAIGGYGPTSTFDGTRAAYYKPFLSQLNQPLPVLGT